jgi:two-component system sensor histidine kinase CpxA
MENVIRNAIRYSPKESAIEISLARDDGRALVDVRDRGPGVPEEALPRLFDPFYRVETDRDRSSGGVGLGLSIARRAIELHHGAIRARNANPGLEVELQLPAVEASA